MLEKKVKFYFMSASRNLSSNKFKDSFTLILFFKEKEIYHKFNINVQAHDTNLNYNKTNNHINFSLELKIGLVSLWVTRKLETLHSLMFFL